MITYSLTSRNLSPSLAIHLPRLLIAEPLNVINCCSPDWNHEPFHCEGKTQFVDAEKNHKKVKINIKYTNEIASCCSSREHLTLDKIIIFLKPPHDAKDF